MSGFVRTPSTREGNLSVTLPKHLSAMHWNSFRILGDFSHLASFFILGWRLMKTKNANGERGRLKIQAPVPLGAPPLPTGISLKTQELYLIVFLTRYLDLFTNKTSLYNTLFKIFYIAASAGLVYLIRFREPFKSMYLFERDTFLHWKFAVLPCAVLALFINDINWTGFNAWLIFREVRVRARGRWHETRL